MAHQVYTLTFENGSEFMQHEKMAAALKAQTSFATPYVSWERGINESANGQVRHFIPKCTNFKLITPA